MPRASYPFVDWMKAAGMSLIVYGHVAHATTVPLTPPIYLKQFGVAARLGLDPLHDAGGILLERALEDVTHALPSFGAHDRPVLVIGAWGRQATTIRP